PEENTYIGDRKLHELRAMEERLPADAPPEQRLGFLVRLGLEELRVGNTTEAIERIAEARALVPAIPSASRDAHAALAAYYHGVAYMRWAETENCVARHTAESCIVPIRAGGIHVHQEGSDRAIESFLEVLRLTPPQTVEHVAAKWLINLAYMTVGGYPDDVPEIARIPASVFSSDADFPRFTDIAPRLGINTFDLCGGAIADDFDGDGLLDLMTTTWDPAGQTRYFRNTGEASFVERTTEAGLDGIVGGLNLLQADHDNDGDLDVLILRGAWLGAAGRHPNSLLRNNGDGSFSDVTFASGLAEVSYPTQTAAWADYDLDGDLDLYIGNEATPKDPFPSQLFRNEGDGTFTDVAAAAGVENLRYAKSVTWGDYDNDRYPDLYVSNMREQNRLYHNNGDGTFSDVASESGVTRPLDSFPAWFWDYDNDGALDLLVNGYHQSFGPERIATVAAGYLGLPHGAELPRLYRGDGRGGFTDTARAANLTLPSMPMGANFGDLNNDGFLDFYLGTGYPAYDGLMPNVMYLNVNGTHFEDVTVAGGFGHLQKGHGVAFADLDEDGDQDVFEQIGGFFPGDGFGNALFENPGFGNNWIKIRLVGVQSNSFGVGSRLRAEIVENGKRRSIYRDVNSGGSFGANPLTQHLGLGRAERVEVLEVFWPASGTTQTFENIPARGAIEITEDRKDYRSLGDGVR
ncbi:MAG: CRTAC1 family protein, partial [Acidobacteriota bacterium]|nr:CRTAC1 family protein [Acidobacteriota bacterium]